MTAEFQMTLSGMYSRGMNVVVMLSNTVKCVI